MAKLIAAVLLLCTLRASATVTLVSGKASPASVNGADITPLTVAASTLTSSGSLIGDNLRVNSGGFDGATISTRFITAAQMPITPFLVTRTTTTGANIRTDSALFYNTNQLILVRGFLNTTIGGNSWIGTISSGPLTGPLPWTSLPADGTTINTFAVSVNTGTASIVLARDLIAIEGGPTGGVPGAPTILPTKRYWQNTNRAGTVVNYMTLDSSGTLALAAVSTAAVFQGFSNEANQINPGNGVIQIGNNSQFNGTLDYNANGQTTLSVINNYDSATAATVLRHRTANGPNAITSLSATATSTTLYGSTMTVSATGVVSAPSQPGAQLYLPGDITLPTGQNNIFWDTTVSNRASYNHSNTVVATSSNVFTAQGTGIYFVSFCARATTTSGYLYLGVRSVASTTWLMNNAGASVTDETHCATGFISATAGDTYEAYVQGGANVTLVGGASHTRITFQKIW